MEDEVIIINLGKPCETSAEDIHSALLQLPANTYLHVFKLMSEIISHSYFPDLSYKSEIACKENNNG